MRNFVRTFVLTLALLLPLNALLADVKDAIYVWVDGTSTCYQLAAMPKVSYEGSKAILTLAGQAEPVLTLSLENGGKLVVTFGIYDDASALESISSLTPVSKVGKYIKGGRLVIVRDGKLFDAEGRLLSNE